MTFGMRCDRMIVEKQGRIIQISGRVNEMYRVELKFDSDNLTPSDMDRICEQTDQIFEREDLSCANREPGRRVYLDRGRQQDYGRFWAAIFALKSAAGISKHLQERLFLHSKVQQVFPNIYRNVSGITEMKKKI